jgi:hypothetical protein
MGENKMAKFQFFGSVSADTMHPRHLIPAFIGVLETLDNERAAAIQSEVDQVIGNGGYDDLSDDDQETIAYILDDLFDVLDKHAPDGYYFGAVEGDGCNYGFWHVEDQARNYELMG